MWKIGLVAVFAFFYFLGKPIFNAMVAKDYGTMASTFEDEREFREANYYNSNNNSGDAWVDPFSQ